jgi:hypothetical protein
MDAIADGGELGSEVGGEGAAAGPIDAMSADGGDASADAGCAWSLAASAPADGSATGALSHPVALALGDFNSDRKLDVAVVNQLSANISVLLGHGDGTFEPAATYTAGVAPRALAVGDLNGDGALDLVIANLGFGAPTTVSVLLGNGDGTFKAQVGYATGTDPVSVAIGDFNRDKKLDVVVTNNLDATVSVLLGNGDGTLQPQVTYSTGVGPTWVVAGDVNGDGNPDLAVAIGGVPSLGSNDETDVLLGNGDGTFRPKLPATAASGANVLAVADLNGDGKPDMAVAERASSTLGVLLGNGDGTFQTQRTYPAGQITWTLAICDANLDGKLDLAVASQEDSTLGVFLGNGDGTFRPQVTHAVGSHPSALATGDLNADGIPDFVTADSDGNDLSVLLGGCGP